MKRLAAAVAFTLAGCANMPETPAPEATLAAAETAFARQSVREGMRAAFLDWLAPGATLYRNGPVDGPATIAANPDPPVVLDWRPAFVEVAASGELGLSTGPWTLTSRKDPTAAPRHGQFVSIWKREPGAPWRVWIDLGISHPGAVHAESPLVARSTPPAAPGPTGPLGAAEAWFAAMAAARGDAAAYAAAASPTVRLYREGHAPFIGRAAALASPAAKETRTAWTVESQGTSTAGDFGYATGRFGPVGGATAGHFVRVWRWEAEGWRIALDVVNALAKP